MPLKILSYNIQAAIGTQSYSHYLTRLKGQLFHTNRKSDVLSGIAEFMSDYDVACVQEVDLGGRRSGFKCQADHLFKLSDFDHISSQENRIVRNISRHGNVVLTKHEQSDVHDLKLPGKRAGRGAIITRVHASTPFFVINTHLSLGLRDQMTQVEFLIDSAPKHVPLIVAGDFNCGSSSLPLQRLASGLDLQIMTTSDHKTYPSWKPRHDFDHILVSSHFEPKSIAVNKVKLSDHLPLHATLNL